jgi:phosphoenolpyruvate-protein phosphotransferase
MSVAAIQEAKTALQTRLQATCISPGLGMGRARLIGDILDHPIETYTISPEKIGCELDRIKKAFEQTRQELDEAARRIEEQFNAELAGIFRAHQVMLGNLLSSQEFEKEVAGSLVNAEAAVKRVFRRWRERFQSSKDEMVQQRADDVADIGRKVLRHLSGADSCRLKHLPAGTVLVIRRLLPSDLVSLSRHQVTAIIVESLGVGSHAALLAREKSIPTVAGIPKLLDQLHNADELFVDADHGEVLIQPDEHAREQFQERLKAYQDSLARTQSVCREPASTLDGQVVSVEANIGVLEDAELAIENGADAIGLFRIEELYLARERPPTADELFEELRAVTAPLRDTSVTIRLLDIGGDKPLSFADFGAEGNPLLGRRGVRVLLEYPQLARTQFEALRRLAQEQPLRILIPMVTLEEDISAMRKMFDSICTGLSHGQRPSFGAMIETPAAALNVAAIASYVDFLSVGSNDLTQYTLAVGRDDPAVSHYYQDNHCSILRLLNIIVADAGQTPLSLCGELAGREQMIPQLLKMGFRSLSMAPPLIPSVKELIRSLRL